MDEIIKLNLGFTNVFLLKTDFGFIQIDAGLKYTSRRYFRLLKRRRINPEDIKLIIVTHAHSDHVGALKIIKTASNAKVLIHEKDRDALVQGIQAEIVPITFVGKCFMNIIPKRMHLYDPVEPDIVINNEYSLLEFGINAKVVHTPGHTSGTISVIDGNGNAFIGFTAHGYPKKLTPGSPAIAVDLDAVFSSWELLIKEGVKKLHPSHGKPFSVEVIKRILEKKKKKKIS